VRGFRNFANASSDTCGWVTLVLVCIALLIASCSTPSPAGTKNGAQATTAVETPIDNGPYLSSARLADSDSDSEHEVVLTDSRCTTILQVEDTSTLAVSIVGSAKASRTAFKCGVDQDLSDTSLVTYSHGESFELDEAWLYLTTASPGRYTLMVLFNLPVNNANCPCSARVSIHKVSPLYSAPTTLTARAQISNCMTTDTIDEIQINGNEVSQKLRGSSTLSRVGPITFNNSSIRWADAQTSLGAIVDEPHIVVGRNTADTFPPDRSCAWTFGA
jgi:hypothetical protein